MGIYTIVTEKSYNKDRKYHQRIYKGKGSREDLELIVPTNNGVAKIALPRLILKIWNEQEIEMDENPRLNKLEEHITL